MIVTDRERYAADCIPRGYGFAYHRETMDTAVYYPIPLNLLARWARRLWIALKRERPSIESRAFAAGFRKGYVAGLRRQHAKWRQNLQTAWMAQFPNAPPLFDDGEKDAVPLEDMPDLPKPGVEADYVWEIDELNKPKDKP